MSALEYLASGSIIKSHTLKLKLFKDGLKERRCELCGISQWQGVDLPLELHHKDGDHYNNDLDNLIVLCPNCHSIQEGNSGKAIKSKEEVAKLAKEVKPTQEAKQPKVCIVCGKPVARRSTYCPDCYARESRIVERPSREELKNLIRTTSFLQIGKTYNVSDNAVRKWCDSYGLPRKSSEIKSYSDEEWEKI
jgi:Zn finger protein HypA/HybF involved in hydrogenase expression